ncbi:MAG: helix-turn-helix transcriptional regulator [Oscillospiraceae bacterium]|nr:helix-turn-helix transcriptional regulator [Oscillospiraceae bacterium]
MIVYDPLWDTMKKKGISQYKLLREYGVSSGQLDRIRKGQSITMYTLDSLCKILNCSVEEIIQYVPEE